MLGHGNSCMMQLNKKQQEAFDLVTSGHNALIHGSIGTGKTTTLAACISQLSSRGVKFAVTASTGLASQQIKCKIVVITMFWSSSMELKVYQILIICGNGLLINVSHDDSFGVIKVRLPNSFLTFPCVTVNYDLSTDLPYFTGRSKYR